MQLVSPALSYEIIVVDNCSRDGAKAMVKDFFPEVHFVEATRNMGFAGGNNLGIKAASGRYLMILNPDIFVLPKSLETLADYLDKHPSVGMVGPKLVNPDGTLQYSCYSFPNALVPLCRRTPFGKLRAASSILERYLMSDWNHESPKDVDWLLGAAIMIKKEALARVGFLDERFFLYFEDTDWCRRFWQAGYSVTYIPESVMIHFHRRLSAEGMWFAGFFKRSTRTHIISALRYFWKYRGQSAPRYNENLENRK